MSEMKRILHITKCRYCPNMMWGECDTADCMAMDSFTHVDPDDISPRCPLPVHDDSTIHLTREQAEEVRDAISEIIELMNYIRDGEYKPDSFTTQPCEKALAILNAAMKEVE